MKVGDKVILYNDPYGYLKALSLGGSAGKKGIITSPVTGDWSAYGVPKQTQLWTVGVGYNHYTIAEPSLILDLDPQTTTKEGNMLLEVTILQTKKDAAQEILVDAGKIVAQDQNTALLLVGAKHGKEITEAVAAGARLQVVARAVA